MSHNPDTVASVFDDVQRAIAAPRIDDGALLSRLWRSEQFELYVLARVHDADLRAAREQIEAARQTNQRLNRRCQEAEAALADFNILQLEGLKGGTFGRALLVWHASKMTEQLETARGLLGEARPWIGLRTAWAQERDAAMKLQEAIDAFLAGGGEKP